MKQIIQHIKSVFYRHRQDIVISGGLVGVVVFILAPVLFFRQAFFGEEQIGFYYAISAYVHAALAGGKDLVWISSYFGGVSASLDQFVGGFYPLNLFLFSHFDFFTAHHLSILIAISVGLIASYFFARAHLLSRPAAITLPFLYLSATGFAWLQIGTTTAHSFMILPVLLLALNVIKVQKRYKTGIIIGSLAFAVGLLAGFMQIIFYDVVIALLYALFLDWHYYKKGRVWFKQCSATIAFFGCTSLGLLIGIKQFLPSASLIDLTIRTNTYAMQNAYYPALSEFVAFFLPPYFAVPYVGGGGSPGFFIGVLFLALGLTALFYAQDRTQRFFAGVYVMFFAFAFHFPIFGWINEHLPPFSHMGGNFRWMVGAAFPLAYIGSYGVEYCIYRINSTKTKFEKFLLWFVGGLFGFLVFSSTILNALISYVSLRPEIIARIIDWYARKKTLFFATDHYPPIILQAMRNVSDMFSFSNPRFFVGVALVGISYLALYIIYSNRFPKINKGVLCVCIAILTVIVPYLMQWSDFVDRSEYTKESQIVEFLDSREEDPHAYRFVTLALGDALFQILPTSYQLSPTEISILSRELLVNNTNIYHNIDRIDGMEPYRMLRHNQLINTVLAFDTLAYNFDIQSPLLETSSLDQLYNRDAQKKVSLKEKIDHVGERTPLLSMMNVKYIISLFPLTDTTFKTVVSIPLAVRDQTFYVYIYENPNVLPRVFFAKNTKVLSGGVGDRLKTMATQSDFKNTTYVECPNCVDESFSGEGNIEVDVYEHGRVSFDTKSATDQVLVFSESSLPGWHAFIDDKEVDIITANYIFQAVRVPKGSHQVRFVYQDRGVLESVVGIIYK